MPTFATPSPIAATVEVAGARVRITASDRTDTVVDVRPLNGDALSIKVAERTEVEFAGGRLSVKTKTAGAKDGSVAITIDLPTGSALAAYLAYSTVQADGLFGASELHQASGRARLEHVAGLRASIASGDVEIGRIGGRADIEGASFSLRIAEAAGPVSFANAGGRTWIGHAAGDLTLGGANSTFDIDRADGDVAVETAGGAIRIGRMTNGRAKLRNASGDIEIGISEDAAASVDVNSERGAVHNYVAAPSKPRPADPKVSIFARTRHGDITVQRS
ncbi:DUF4097 family beta strand repeat-containing protein [Microlunatus speluncae]|uniref:DUF4097 family beta strand repeat-containing protein n=1 Tax=Microlunatus speluncae TaxID=2594267 RepID=UPI0012661495|nr:DUF4097 family beta strand repeat-containing protein [Microlunatus speluncae]